MNIKLNSSYINLINDTIPHSGKFNMEFDEWLYTLIKSNYKKKPILRIYEWEKPTITYGKFQNKQQFNLKKCLENNIELVKRPTGGRAILHYNEITFSFCLSKKHITPYTFRALFIFIAENLVNMFRALRIKSNINLAPTHYESSNSCFNSLSQYEIVDSNNNKLAGIAQYFTSSAALIQGSLPLADNSGIKKYFNDNQNIAPLANELIKKQISKDEIRKSLIEKFSVKLKTIF